MNALEVRDLHLDFGGPPVLAGVSLSVASGECLAVVGSSGAGKSVLARSLLGLAGEGGAPARVRAERIMVDGVDLTVAGERAWRAVRGRRIGLVLQDALGSLDPLRTVGAEVAEPLRLHTRLTRTARAEAAEQALARAGLDRVSVRARQRSQELSGGMRQRALIASALVTAPPLVVLDEPTTALDATVARGVLDLLARLRAEGSALLLITHDLGVVAHLADRVAVLAAGRIVESGPTAQVLATPRHQATVDLLAALPRGAKPAPARTGPVILAARGLTRVYPVPGGAHTAVDRVDLTVHRGESLGVVGESGSGKSTLARLLVAAEAPDSGQVLLDGTAWSTLPERARRPARRRVRLVPQDPLGSMDPRRRVGRLLRDAGAAPAAVAGLLARVHLDPAVADRLPRSLSGGQRQRVSIARALASAPELLVLDEPVSALDVQVQAGILDLLAELQRDGLAMVLISHDLAVVRQVCDSVAVMSQGRIVERGGVEQVWAGATHPVTRALLAAALPVSSPPRAASPGPAD